MESQQLSVNKTEIERNCEFVKNKFKLIYSDAAQYGRIDKNSFVAIYASINEILNLYNSCYPSSLVITRTAYNFMITFECLPTNFYKVNLHDTKYSQKFSQLNDMATNFIDLVLSKVNNQ